MYPLTWLLRSYDLVKHDLVSPDFIIAPIDPNIKKNIIENTLRHLVETSLFSVKPGVGKTLRSHSFTPCNDTVTFKVKNYKINFNWPRSKTWSGLVVLDWVRFVG